MDLQAKTVSALDEAFHPELLTLEEEEGLSGFIVAKGFQGLTGMERQERIQKALAPLSSAERRRVVMIAALTPAEYGEIGTPIRVRGIGEKGGQIAVILQGGHADAERVRAIFERAGMTASKPRSVADGEGVFTEIRIKGSPRRPATKESVLGLLATDPVIEMDYAGRK